MSIQPAGLPPHVEMPIGGYPDRFTSKWTRRHTEGTCLHLPILTEIQMNDCDVAIVGAGLAGMCCARVLTQAGLDCRLYEASDDVGGRVRTDQANGFLLDRGFQVFLTSYPEPREVLDFERLDLKPFEPGAKVRFRGGWHRIVDPWRRPQHLFATLLSPVGGFGDKLRVGKLRKDVCRGSLNSVMERPESTTLQRLQQAGLSDAMIERFMKPFLGGVFLERDLTTSSRMFDFVFRMFATGEATLPANGMGQISKTLAAQLPADSVQLNSPVDELTSQSLTLHDGSRIQADQIVLAVDAQASARLLGCEEPPATHSVSCLYFAADEPPVEEPILVLNGEGDGPINNLCVPSQVSTAYAPQGKALVSVSVLEEKRASDTPLEVRVRKQLINWFGDIANSWSFIRQYDIDGALPDQSPPHLEEVVKPALHDSGVYLCGDYLNTASIEGAMASGRRAAEAILAAREEGQPA